MWWEYWCWYKSYLVVKCVLSYHKRNSARWTNNVDQTPTTNSALIRMSKITVLWCIHETVRENRKLTRPIYLGVYPVKTNKQTNAQSRLSFSYVRQTEYLRYLSALNCPSDRLLSPETKKYSYQINEWYHNVRRIDFDLMISMLFKDRSQQYCVKCEHEQCDATWMKCYRSRRARDSIKSKEIFVIVSI